MSSFKIQNNYTIKFFALDAEDYLTTTSTSELAPDATRKQQTIAYNTGECDKNVYDNTMLSYDAFPSPLHSCDTELTCGGTQSTLGRRE